VCSSDLKQIRQEYVQVTTRQLNKDEVVSVNNLRDKKFATYKWIYGASPEFNYSKTMRFNGCGTINLSMGLSKSNMIENCKITGDFFGSGDVSDIEGLLTDCTRTQDSILNAMKAIDIKSYFEGLEIADFLMLFKGPEAPTSNT
jgi:lipoate-protein ligase A